MREKKNVLFVEYCKGLKAGGAQRVFINILKSVVVDDINAFAAFPDMEESAFRSEIPGEIKIFNYDSKSPESKANKFISYFIFIIFIPFILFRWMYIIKKHNIQVVYVHSIISGFHFSLIRRLMKIKLIYHEHNMASQRPSTIFWNKLFLFVNKSTDLVIAISEGVEKSLVEHGVDKNKIKVIHNGIEIMDNDIDIRKKGIKRLSISPETFVIGMVGHFRPWKGQKIFIEAIALVSEDIPTAKFVIVGGVHDNAYYQEVVDYIKSNKLENKVIITGYQENVHELIAAMDIVVVPSVPEPFGLVVLEGMMMNKPVISFNIGGPAEIINHMSTGYLIEKVDYRGLADGIKYLSGDKKLRISLGDAGRMQLENEYTHIQQGKKISEEIISLLSK